MTQKDKLIAARVAALEVKRVATTLRRDALEFDCKFPIPHAEKLEQITKDLLKIL